NEFSKKQTSKHKETISKKKKSEEKPIEPAVHYAYEEENHEQLTLPINDEKEESEFTPVIKTENDNSNYILLRIAVLKNQSTNNREQETSAITDTVKVLEDTFVNFGVKVTVSNVDVGPAVTKYEINPEAGVKVSRIVKLHDDLALALAA